MTERSYNGWPASTNPHRIGVVPLSVAGVSFPGGVKRGPVHVILGHVAMQHHKRVEPLISPGCWGWSYRKNRNANNLSCHSSATAIDVNAPQHPNGVPASRTFSQKQMRTIHQILSEIPELDSVVRWGGDFHGTPDAMHYEIKTSNVAMVNRVAKRIIDLEENDMKKEEIQSAPLTIIDAHGKNVRTTLGAVIKQMEEQQDENTRMLRQILAELKEKR